VARHWVLKTEPSEYGFPDLVRDRRTRWEGVSNPVALKHLRSMLEGDDALTIHPPEDGKLRTAAIATYDDHRMAMSMALFEWAVRKDGVVAASPGPTKLVASFFSQLLRNPLVVGILCGLAGRMIGLELPALAARLVDSLAAVAAPVALFAMGAAGKRSGSTMSRSRSAKKAPAATWSSDRMAASSAAGAPRATKPWTAASRRPSASALFAWPSATWIDRIPSTARM